MARVSVVLILIALIASLAGCQAAPAKQYQLTITSTQGGNVTLPGEGVFTYDAGRVIELMAQADRGYNFVAWTGDVNTIGDVGAASTTMVMNADYSITATFQFARTGAFLDEVIITAEPSPEAAIQQLKRDALDIYAFGLRDPRLYADVMADPTLTSVSSAALCHEFTFNPVGPTFPGTGKLNPFSDRQLREAINWLIDRDYMCSEIMGGLAVPQYTCLHPTGADMTQRFASEMALVVSEYGHNPARAHSVITERMTSLGAQLVKGKWQYNGEEVQIIGLIRTEDERKHIGDYLAALLEREGFTVIRQYGVATDLLPLWWRGDPALGKWHFYTGGWIYSAIPRDEGDSFAFFYTKLGRPELLWQAYENDPDFYEAAEKLWNYDYDSIEERAGYFRTCLDKSMEDSARVFLLTPKTFSPMRADVRVVHDYVGGLSGGIFYYYSNQSFDRWESGSWVWALTAHFVGDAGEPVVGGTMRIAMPDLLVDPWNPIGGSDLVYDMFPIKATADRALQLDTRTGLSWPGRVKKAEVFVQAGLAVSVTNKDWCSLKFVPQIQVPLDAWADWDATQQKLITVQQKYGSNGTTAKTKSVSYYPKDIFDIPLHDGSTLSMGDFILYTILQFDRAKPESAIYDEAYVGQFNDFMSKFKGVRFITGDPNWGLIVEYYSDSWQLDAELIATAMFPYYSQGPGMWHTVALGIRAEEDKALAFSEPKSSRLGVEWMNFIDGPSLPILKSYLDSAKATNYIPYEPTMGVYVSKAEAAERWSHLERWYSDKGHFWVASGPFYLESVDTANKVIHLKRFEDYPDPADRWLFLLEPLP